MFKRLFSYLKILLQLIKTDMLLLRQNLVDEFIDTFIWASSIMLVTTYVFPSLGMFSGFGAFAAVSMIVSLAIFEMFSTASSFISDIEGDNTISYFLGLPLPSWLVVVRLAMSHAVRVSIYSSVIIPLAKLILWDRMDLSHFSIFKFFIIYFLINIFSGFLLIFITSFVKRMSGIGMIWTRMLFPLWFFGGTQYPWATIYDLSKRLGIILLANPLIYATEGIRAAVLGQDGNLSYWVCVLMLTLFSCLFGYLAVRRLKKRLDFV